MIHGSAIRFDLVGSTAISDNSLTRKAGGIIGGN
jgi:hypothetical protein